MAKDITIGEMKAYDIDNLEHVLKQAEEHRFSSHAEATGFVHACLFTTLEKLGVIVNERIDPALVDKMLNDHHVKVESRRYDEEEDKWREGIYIYKTDEDDIEREIVGFISAIRSKESSVLVAPEVFTVRTNSKS